MKKTTLLLSAIVALCAAQTGVAFGQERGHDDQRGRDAQRGDEHRGDDHRGGNAYRGDDHRGGYDNGERRNDRNYGYQGDRHDGPRGDGAGPWHNMHRGERLAPEFNNRQYVVDDWRGHRLSAPPRGYHWVQAGGDYVLVAITTGIIANILLNH